MQLQRPALFAFALCLALVGCQTPPGASGWKMVEKGEFQVLFKPDGQLERLLYDKNGDGRAEMVVMYAGGKITVSEIDTDLNGVVDRWDYFGVGGELAKIGRARRKPGKADAWEVVDKSGEVSRREFDEDDDGKVDRTEYLARGKVFLEELDTNHDGKPDRRQFLAPDGAVLRVELDQDADGFWDPAAR